MAQFSRLEVVVLMEDNGMVPLFHHDDPEICKKVLKACYDGGARLLEFTARGDNSHLTFTELLKYAQAELPGMCLGVGSLTDAAAASLYIQIGANFVVTPTLRKDIAIVCNRQKVLWSPGCGSLSEINAAEELGCEIIKLFPASIYGPGMVKAIKGPQPWTSIMPTGGISLEENDLRAWFQAGITCVGMGSQLIDSQIIGNSEYKKLEVRVRDTLSLIRKIRQA